MEVVPLYGTLVVPSTPLTPWDTGTPSAIGVTEQPHSQEEEYETTHGPHQPDEYVCPEHTEVRHAVPGMCPDCGSKLVRMPGTRREGYGSEARVALLVSGGARCQVTEEGEGSESWMCPEHSDVRTPQPGGCPVCGRDLVPAEEPEGGAV